MAKEKQFCLQEKLSRDFGIFFCHESNPHKPLPGSSPITHEIGVLLVKSLYVQCIFNSVDWVITGVQGFREGSKPALRVSYLLYSL